MTAITFAEVKVLRSVILHPWDCLCATCAPFYPQPSTNAGPSQMMVVSLADEDDPPPGWKRPGMALQVHQQL